MDSEDLSILSSDEEIDLKQEGQITVLGNGISNQFTLYLSTVRDEEDQAVASDSDTPSSKRQ